MARIRVLDVRDTHEIGGPGKTILETQRAIDRDRFDLHVAVFQADHESLDTPFVVAARDVGLKVHAVRARGPYDLRMIGRLARLVRTEGIDIVHAHESISDLVALFALPLHRARTMTTLHGWIGNSRKQRLMIAADRQVVRRFDRVIAVSQRIRDAVLAAGASASRVVLLHNAIVTERYRRTGQRGALASVLGCTPPGPILISIGRLSAEKGHADLLEALARVAAGGHAFSAVFAGEGSERGRLEEMVRTLGLDGRVYLAGWVNRPERLLEEVDLMVLPSHTEGLPNVVLEALMMDVPVLATRVGGTPEILTDGVSGRLVEPRRPDQLAAGIVDFLTARARWAAMAAEGKRVVREQFDFASRTRRLEAIYTELAGGTR